LRITPINMAAANGTLTPPVLPPAPTSPSAAKRKRFEGTNTPKVNGASTADEKAVNGNHLSVQAVMKDIVSILKRYVRLLIAHRKRAAAISIEPSPVD
jgi:hypothetical protein